MGEPKNDNKKYILKKKNKQWNINCILFLEAFNNRHHTYNCYRLRNAIPNNLRLPCHSSSSFSNAFPSHPDLSIPSQIQNFNVDSIEKKPKAEQKNNIFFYFSHWIEENDHSTDEKHKNDFCTLAVFRDSFTISFAFAPRDNFEGNEKILKTCKSRYLFLDWSSCLQLLLLLLLLHLCFNVAFHGFSSKYSV